MTSPSCPRSCAPAACASRMSAAETRCAHVHGHGHMCMCMRMRVPRGRLLRKSGVHAWACVCLADVWTCTCHGACALRMHTLMHMHMHMHMHRCARCRACTPSTRSAPKSGSRRRRCPLHAYMHTCIPSYVQCIHACTHACNARMHAMHSCTHARMHSFAEEWLYLLHAMHA